MLNIEGIIVLLALILGHVVGDFFLQPDKWVLDKLKNKCCSKYLYAHSLLHGLITLAILYFSKADKSYILGMSFLVAVMHYVVDLAKVSYGRGYKSFLADQFAHITVLFIVWLYLFQSSIPEIEELIKQVNYIHVIVFSTAYILMLKPSAVLVGEILSKWSEEIKTLNGGNQSSLTEAGKYLGYIERVLILTFVLSAQYSAVGFILAAKSIFRMGDLRRVHDRKFTEYVMLGSLFSAGVALFCGLFITEVLDLTALKSK